jgi:deoxycytidine triphosphate deaminase
MLNRDEIKDFAIITDGSDQCYRAASYDVRIGILLASRDGDSVRDTGCYVLQPQGMVEVISLEIIKVPRDIAGYASVKTDLSRQGLLALNTGILDPGYEGPVSATVVNFGKTEKTLNRGEVFLRLTFHPYKTPNDFKALGPVRRDEFVLRRKEQVDANFSSSFLDMPRLVQQIASKYLSSFLWRVWVTAGAVALVVAVFAFLTTWAVSYLQPYNASKDRIRGELGSYFRDQQFDSFQKEIEDIQKRELPEEVQRAVDRALTKAPANAGTRAGQSKSGTSNRPLEQ